MIRKLTISILLMLFSIVGFGKKNGTETSNFSNQTFSKTEDSVDVWSEFINAIHEPVLCSKESIFYFYSVDFFNVHAVLNPIGTTEYITLENGGHLPEQLSEGDSLYFDVFATHFNGESVSNGWIVVVESCGVDTNECVNPTLPIIPDTISICDEPIRLTNELSNVHPIGSLVSYEGNGVAYLNPSLIDTEYNFYDTEIIYFNSCGDSSSVLYTTFVTEYGCCYDTCVTADFPEIPDTISSCDNALFLGNQNVVYVYGDLIHENSFGELFLDPSKAVDLNSHYETFVFTFTACGVDSTVRHVFVTDYGCVLDSCVDPVLPVIPDTIAFCDSSIFIAPEFSVIHAFGELIVYEATGSTYLQPSLAESNPFNFYETELIYFNSCGDSLSEVYLTFITDYGCGIDTNLTDTNIVIVDDCISPFGVEFSFPETIANCNNPLPFANFWNIIDFHSAGCGNQSGEYDVSHLKAGFVDQITYSYINYCGDTLTKEQSILITDCEESCSLEKISGEVYGTVPSGMCLNDGLITISTKNARVISYIPGIGVAIETGVQSFSPRNEPYFNGDIVNLVYVGVFPGCEDSVYFEHDINLSDCGLVSGTKKSSLQKLTVFPNPVRDIINVSAPFEIGYTKIYNLSGLLELEGNGGLLETSSLENGFYFLEVKDMEGNIYKQKILKE